MPTLVRSTVATAARCLGERAAPGSHDSSRDGVGRLLLSDRFVADLHLFVYPLAAG